jgi:hypothetical protein
MTVAVLMMAIAAAACGSSPAATVDVIVDDGDVGEVTEESTTSLATAGASVLVGDMGEQRQWLSTVMLADGRVLVAGGNSPTWAAGSVATAEVWTPGPGTWDWTAEMADARFSNGLVLLPDGRVLTAGGRGIKNHAIDTAEIWDPATGVWTAAASMNAAHEKMPMILLPDGRVLVVGGANEVYKHLPTTEIYDVAADTWTELASMVGDRIWHTGTLLSDGRVLITGGGKPDGPFLKSAEIYDLEADKWLSAGDMTVSRAQHSATLLKDGRVLVVGGRGKRTTSEIYDPETNSWGSLSDTNAPRAEHVAVLLPDGRVAVAGGTGSQDTVEVYDPATNEWTVVGGLLTGRYRSSLTLLPDGGLLIIGGQGRDGVLAQTELFTLGLGPEVAAQVRTGEAVEQEPTPEIAPDATATPRPTPTAQPLNLAFEFPDAVEANPTGETTLTELGIPARVPLGQEMTSPKGVVAGMTARFVKVIEDTRCPAGQTCDAPGRVVIQISLRADSPLGTSELTIEDGQTGTTIKRYGKYSVGFLALDDDADGVKATLVILLSN